MSSPMTPIIRRLKVYYARRDRFTYPGVHVWAFGRHWRVVPLPKRRSGAA